MTLWLFGMQATGFTGASCMRVSQVAGNPSVTSEIYDLDALFDPNNLGANAVLAYSTCATGNCAARSIPLSASGHYSFNLTNSGATPAWWAVNYILYPRGDPGLLLGISATVLLPEEPCLSDCSIQGVWLSMVVFLMVV